MVDEAKPGSEAPSVASDAQARPTDEPPTVNTLPPTSGADAIVRKWSLWAAGFGLLPLPLVDFATTTTFSLKMLRNLARYYGVEFRSEIGKAAISSLLGGASSPLLALAASSALKSVPLVGLPLAVFSGPIAAGGVAYALGRVFIAHFGAGGSLFDFDPEKFRDYFCEQVKAGRAFLGGAA